MAGIVERFRSSCTAIAVLRRRRDSLQSKYCIIYLSFLPVQLDPSKLSLRVALLRPFGAAEMQVPFKWLKVL